MQGEGRYYSNTHTQDGRGVSTVHGPACLVDGVNVEQEYHRQYYDGGGGDVVEEEVINVAHGWNDNAQHYYGNSHTAKDVL